MTKSTALTLIITVMISVALIYPEVHKESVRKEQAAEEFRQFQKALSAEYDQKQLKCLEESTFVPGNSISNQTYCRGVLLNEYFTALNKKAQELAL